MSDFDPIRTSGTTASGKDGHGSPTPTVRELAALLASLPEDVQDLPVTRYCDEGVAGISYALRYEREHDPDEWTAHVALW